MQSKNLIETQLTPRQTKSPQDSLDEFVKQVLCDDRYKGTQDLGHFDPAFESLLAEIRKVYNEALRLENANAAGDLPHLPFHFDYLEATVPNALAFQYDGYAFIAVTLPLVELIWRISEQLSLSSQILQLLKVNAAISGIEDLHVIFFVSQLSFLIGHEYTHHIHGHVPHVEFGTEPLHLFSNNASRGLQRQAQEVDADGFAVYLVLTHLIIGDRRAKTLEGLGHSKTADGVADELLLTSFIVAVGSFFMQWRR